MFLQKQSRSFGALFRASVAGLILFGAATSLRAQLGGGWVLYAPTKKIHLDDEGGLQTFNWTSYKAVCSNTVCADYTYDSATDTETFRIFDGRSNRSEIRLQNEYTTGRRQFEGYLTFYSPLEDESLMQIFGSTSGATLTMTRGYSSSGGRITVTGTGGGVTFGSTTIATGIYGVEVRMNIIHLQDDVVRWYVNGTLKCEQLENEVGVANYHKYGCYGTTSGNVPAIVKWRAARSYRDGFLPGAGVAAEPAAMTVNPGGGSTTRIDATGLTGTVTLSASNVPAGATVSFNPGTIANGNGSSTLTLTTTNSLPTGHYALTIRATDSATNSATVVNVGVLPAGWTGADVGGPGEDGWSSFSNGVYTVNGGGNDIWSTADKFHFAHQAFSGDVTLTARISGQEATDPWAKAGLMIRESTNANAKYVGLYVTPSNGISLQARASAGVNATNHGTFAGFAAPYWIRLQRSGTTFTGFRSPDGVVWTPLVATNLPLNTDTLIGLAVTAHNDSTLNTSTFTDVEFPPNFSLATAPASRTVPVGGATNYQVTLAIANGFSNTVTFSANGLPAGTTADFNPPALAGAGAATLTLTTSGSTPAGTYQVSIVGSDGVLSRTNTVTLAVTANLIWSSTASTAWDLSALNWFNEQFGTTSAFSQGSDVVFADRANVITNVTIASGVSVSPDDMTVSGTNHYSIGGLGKISGGAKIVKEGSGTLTLGTTNDFTGAITVAGGILKVGVSGALGVTNGITTVSGGTLDVNGVNVSAEPVRISGDGANNLGAVINTGPSQTVALRQVTLTGDTTFGGTSRWDIRNTGGTASLNTLPGGSAFKITKVGTNQVSLVGLSVIDSALGDIDVKEGMFGVQTSTTQLGNPAATMTVFSNATLNLFRLTNTPLNKLVVMKGGATFFSENDRNVVRGAVALESGSVTFNVNNSGGSAPALILSNLVSGLGRLVKVGSGPLILTATNAYTGGTIVSNGTLMLTGSGSISDSEAITIHAGAVFDVSGRSDKTLSLEGDQVLRGNGTLNGSLVVGASATLSPGDSIGALTVTNVVSLQGTVVIELNKASGTNDVVRGAASIQYGGALTMTNLGGALASGDSFKIFHGSSYSGAFTTISPSVPAPGLIWDTSQLITDGRLNVALTPRPAITSFNAVGGNLVLAGTNGAPNGVFYLLTSTNVTLPLAEWTIIATNAFNGSGQFNLTNPVDGTPQSFYLLKVD